MSKTSETLFPGEYSRSEATQNLNDLVRSSSFLNDAILLTKELPVALESITHGDKLDAMTSLFTLCNEYETRYQAIIKKALDEALAKVRAKNDLNSIVQDFIPSYDLKEPSK